MQRLFAKTKQKGSSEDPDKARHCEGELYAETEEDEPDAEDDDKAWKEKISKNIASPIGKRPRHILTGGFELIGKSQMASMKEGMLKEMDNEGSADVDEEEAIGLVEPIKAELEDDLEGGDDQNWVDVWNKEHHKE